VFPPEVRLVRGYLIDYLGKEFSPEQICKAIMDAVGTHQLTLEKVLEIIDDIEKDPLCLPYIPKTVKNKKLKQLRKLLASIT